MDLGEEIVLEKLTCSVLESLKKLFILFNKNVAIFVCFVSLLFFKPDGTVVLLSFRHIR